MVEDQGFMRGQGDDLRRLPGLQRAETAGRRREQREEVTSEGEDRLVLGQGGGEGQRVRRQGTGNSVGNLGGKEGRWGGGAR